MAGLLLQLRANVQRDVIGLNVLVEVDEMLLHCR